jgi:hypothetical protein
MIKKVWAKILKMVSSVTDVLLASCFLLFWKIGVLSHTGRNTSKNNSTIVIPGKPMMTSYEKEVVLTVYRRFLENESDDCWTDMDDNLLFFDMLTDQEIINESLIKLESSKSTVFRCKLEHDQVYCMAPLIREAAVVITNLFKETKELHEKNRYVLMNYLVMCELKIIYSQ